MKRFKLMLLSLMLLSFSAQAAPVQDGDLVLDGEKWIASFNGYVCDDSGEKVMAPASFSERGVEFERITTDRTLDNGLVKATFWENASKCRYSAILFADNDKSTIQLVESKAYALDGQSSCEEGKALLDEAFFFNDYLYYGHPHNLAVMVPALGASDVCGGSNVGVNFVVSGRIRN